MVEIWETTSQVGYNLIGSNIYTLYDYYVPAKKTLSESSIRHLARHIGMYVYVND